ncbi:MAG TPA: AarF/UbiB family protein, partial [Burkholderiaceae bacterium]|nr:AarF/UbiB family protein [Burkholderiaceae bacterium]
AAQGAREIVRQLARTLRGELDLAVECRSAERVAASFRDDPAIVVPKVYWDWTGERVNVQAFVVGTPSREPEALAAAGLDRRVLAHRGAQAMLKMVLEDGFFHADPHPGNVFYLPGNRLAFIDFGMVGRLAPQRRDELLQLLLGLVQHEPQAVADVLLDWTGDGHGVDLSRLEAEIEAFVDQYHGTPLAELNLGQMLTDVTAILREHQLALPSDLALLIKCFVSLESMGRGLDPDFHMASEALPLLRETVRARWRPRALALRTWGSMRRALALAGSLPGDLTRLLRNARRGRVHVGLEIAHLKRVGDQIDHAANRLALALIVAALIIGSSIVMTVGGGPTLFGLPAFGLLGFVGAVAGAVSLVRSIRRERQRDRDNGL